MCKNADMINRQSRSISTNLTISLVVVIMFISTAFIAIYYYQISRRERLRLENTADEYIQSIASTLEIPLWAIDRENIQTVCDYYSRNDAVAMVELVGASKEVMFRSEKKQTVDERALIQRTRDIVHNREWIGRVTIALSPLPSREIKLDLLKSAVAALCISIAGLIIFTGLLLKKALREPMDFLGRIAKSYSSGDYHPQSSGGTYKEFEPLLSALVDMGARIESQVSELQHAEKTLKKHRDHLEEMIVQRTKELEISNQELKKEIQDRKKVQEELTANQQRMAAIFRASPVGIGLTMNRRLRWANETFYHMVGYDKDSLTGQDASILYEDMQEHRRVGKELFDSLMQTAKISVETKWIRRDGTSFECNLTASSLDIRDPSKGYIFAVADISEAKGLEARLQRAEKMEMIGLLAGGVAHDLNNILSGLVSYPELLLMDIPKESPLYKPLTKIQKSGERAAEIVQDLLTMTRRGVAVTDVVNLNQVISESLKSPEMEKLKSLHPDVQLGTDLESELLNVMGSSTHISKSIMNLLFNAAEAMPDGGKIEISTSNIYLDTPIKGYEHIAEGDYVKITVADTGFGLPREDIEKIFEPFYTKKKMGRSGTGLGMAVVWGTVKDHSGYIDVQSEEGKGTRFTIYLPVTREKLKTGEIDMPFVEYQGNGESILVVDDVEEQREIATVILERLGYTVTSVASGEEAVRYMKNHSADLLVLDMIMDPGMDGLDTYKRILAYHPGQKAIISSGFSRTERVKELQHLGAGHYVNKPYTFGKIGAAVKDELRKT